MSQRISIESIAADLAQLGIGKGDVVLIRAGLRAVGKIRSADFLSALLQAVGEEGTIVSLAFTHGSWLRRPDPAKAFHRNAPSYAGSLPNAMLNDPRAIRSRHPIASYIAIGRHAEQIVGGHGPDSLSYEPLREVIALGGKSVLVGCVSSSPGFTTAHLAEADLGLLRRVVMPWLTSTYYITESGQQALYRCRDVGLCSQSYWKFYGHYVREQILYSGFVGKGYSIMASAQTCYKIERDILAGRPRFNVCDSPDCFMCNAGRWDRIYRLPIFAARRMLQRAGLLHRRGAIAQSPGRS